MEGRWKLYILRCADSSLYTGITTDVERRVREHNGSKTGARYTRGRRPVTLLKFWRFETRSEASRAEYAFKSLQRPEKLDRIQENDISGLIE